MSRLAEAASKNDALIDGGMSIEAVAASSGSRWRRWRTLRCSGRCGRS